MVIAELAKKDRKGKEEQDQWGIFRLEIECKKGIWLNEKFPAKKHSSRTLRDEGITFDESANARLIGSEPELVQQVIEAIKAESKKVVTPSLVVSGIRKIKQEEEIEKIKAKIKTEHLTTNSLYDVLAIDPPWNYGGEYDPDNRRVTSPYPEMSIEDISKIQLPIKPDAVVFLWTTHKFLPDAFKLVDLWCLEYKATIVWNKVKMGIGNNIRMQCEFCLLCTKGKPLLNGSNVRDIITEARRQHSRKPEAFYKLVETLTTGKKLDYFSREKRNGWESFGIETNKFKGNVE
jgi:N6-adenosine-specific RNA methylase IME4